MEAARAPRLLRELVEAALEPSPEDRPTADEALRALEEAGVSAEKIAVVRRLAQRVVVGM